LGINAGTVYTSHPMGDSPELMPLNCSLFKDVHVATQRNVNLILLLPDDDPKKFSMATPKTTADYYKHLLDPLLGPEGGVASLLAIRKSGKLKAWWYKG